MLMESTVAAGAHVAVRVTTTEPVKAEATADVAAAAAKDEATLEKQPKKSRKTSASTKCSAPGTVKVHNSRAGDVLLRALVPPCLKFTWQLFCRELLQREFLLGN